MRVYLHIGAGKTGTSALQAGLVQHRGALAAAGVHYARSFDDADRRAGRGEITSGNAVALARHMNSKLKPQPDPDAIRAWIAGSIAEADGRHLLYSSEFLQFAPEPGIRSVAETFARARYTPVVICYVRHLLDHAVAVYGQHAKQGLEGLAASRPPITSLGEWICRYRLPFEQYLAPWAAVLGPGAIRVRLYDRDRAALLPEFLAMFGLSVRGGAGGGGPAGLVNRSPSPVELALFEALARRPDGPALCKGLTRLLMNRPGGGGIVVDAADYEVFAARNDPLRQAFNQAWFAGEDALQLRSDRAAIGAAAAPDPAALTEVFGDALAAMLEADAARKREALARRGRARPEP